jgi:hypothetical protein
VGIEVKVDVPANSGYALQVATQRGLMKAGAAIMAISDRNAPTEPDPKHGIHMTETGFVRADVIGGEDVVIIGYEAFWAGWQEAHENWNHPHGGEAKFLELALVEGEPIAMDIIAAAIAEALG